MNQNKNSDVTAEITVVSPEFSLLHDLTVLDKHTVDAFIFADKKGRRILFEMRRLIQFLSSYESSETDLLFNLKHYLNAADIPANIHVMFPGNIDSFNISADEVDKIISIANSITISHTNPYLSKLIRHMETNGCPSITSFNIQAERRVSAGTAKLLSELWKKGVDLTLCNKQNILNMLSAAGIDCTGTFDVFRGMLTVPGKTVVSRIPVEITEENEYTAIKEMLREKIKAEISRKFARSTKGTLYYRNDKTDENLYSLGLLYNKCISTDDGKIKSILCGGADYDILNFQIFRSSGDGTTVLEAAKSLSAACRYLDGLYPLKPLPSFRDIRRAESTSDLNNIIKDHTSISAYMGGGAILELDAGGTDIFSNSDLLASFISDFFGHGGMMLKLLGGESFRDNK